MKDLEKKLVELDDAAMKQVSGGAGIVGTGLNLELEMARKIGDEGVDGKSCRSTLVGEEISKVTMPKGTNGK